MRQILIDKSIFFDRAFILDNGKLDGFVYEEKSSHGLVGNIYKGRVTNILPGMDAAFVDVGLSKNAYIYIDALLSDKFLKEKGLKRKNVENINQVLKKGEELLVEISREPMGEKNISVTTDVSIPGKLIALIPKSFDVNISKKITSPEERKRLSSIGREIMTDDYGMIIRTYAQGCDKERIKEEYTMLLSIYKQIEKKFNYCYAPKLLYKSNPLLEKIFQDYVDSNIDEIYVEDKKTKDKVNDLIDWYSIAGKLNDITVIDNCSNLFDTFNLEKQINMLLSRKVELENGGSIFIDVAEALTVIDVNSGSFVGSESGYLDETAMSINLAAMEEIARQVRLRNISGIIIIDFIDMKNKQYINILIEKAKEFFKKDKARTKILGMTKLNLLEMTRKKDKENFFNIMTETCKCCNGGGKNASLAQMLFKIENIAKKVVQNTTCEAVVLKLGRHIYDKINADTDCRFRKIEDEYGIKLILVEAENLLSDEIKIERMGKLDYINDFMADKKI